MKYMYMICILLSSIFTYKSSSAKNDSYLYAFFIPQGAMQQNRTVKDIRLMRPRHIKTKESPETPKQEDAFRETSSVKDSPAHSLSYSPSDNQISARTATNTAAAGNSTSQNTPVAPQKNKTAAKNLSVQPTRAPSTSTASPVRVSLPASAEMPAEIAQKVQQYSLDNTPLPQNAQKLDVVPVTMPQIKLSHIEALKKKSISDLLDALPYPNSDLPKFKQLYAIYGMELRVLQRRGKLPNNSEQEKTLSKANSLRRFEVK